jgi:hypothetical protein
MKILSRNTEIPHRQTTLCISCSFFFVFCTTSFDCAQWCLFCLYQAPHNKVYAFSVLLPELVLMCGISRLYPLPLASPDATSEHRSHPLNDILLRLATAVMDCLSRICASLGSICCGHGLVTLCTIYHLLVATYESPLTSHRKQSCYPQFQSTWFRSQKSKFQCSTHNNHSREPWFYALSSYLSAWPGSPNRFHCNQTDPCLYE